MGIVNHSAPSLPDEWHISINTLLEIWSDVDEDGIYEPFDLCPGDSPSGWFVSNESNVQELGCFPEDLVSTSEESEPEGIDPTWENESRNESENDPEIESEQGSYDPDLNLVDSQEDEAIDDPQPPAKRTTGGEDRRFTSPPAVWTVAVAALLLGFAGGTAYLRFNKARPPSEPDY